MEQFQKRLKIVNKTVHQIINAPQSPTQEGFFKRQLALVVFDINRMEGTISPSMEDGRTFKKITEYMDNDCIIPEALQWNSEGEREHQSPSSDRQLYQFTKASQYLLVDNLHSDLTLDLIETTYKIMMQNSYVEDHQNQRTMIPVDGVRVPPQEVYAGFYQFLPAVGVRRTVIGLAAYYNGEECRSLHPLTRATLLFYELITIHPFMNGNGRICRLLLTWSIMRDGIPFPISFSSGHRKKCQHYLHAIESARRPNGHRGVLNVLLLTSLERVLGNFLENQRLMENANAVDDRVIIYVPKHHDDDDCSY